MNQGKTEIPEQNTLVGEATCVRGSIAGSGDIVVNGRIEGELRTDGAVFIESTGAIQANIVAASVTVRGVVVGSIIADQSVQITAEGRVVGDICTPRFSMAEGALYRGHVETNEEIVRSTLAEVGQRSALPAVRNSDARQRPVTAVQQSITRRTSSAPRAAIPAPPPPARVTFKPVESKSSKFSDRTAPPPAPPAPFQTMLIKEDELFSGAASEGEGTPAPAMIGKRRGALKTKK